MTEYSARVHVRPMLILMDVLALLCLLVGGHDLLNPDQPIVHPNLQFDYYVWILLAAGAVLLLLSVVTMVRMFSGKSVVSAEDIG